MTIVKKAAANAAATNDQSLDFTTSTLRRGDQLPLPLYGQVIPSPSTQMSIRQPLILSQQFKTEEEAICALSMVDYSVPVQSVQKAINAGHLKDFAELNQFILWTLQAKEGKDGSWKIIKVPINWRTGKKHDAHDSTIWMTAENACQTAQVSDGYGIGGVFTKNDSFFIIDIDHCIDSGVMSHFACKIISMFPGAYVEISQSGTGLHIIARYEGQEPLHAKTYSTEVNGIKIKLCELYTSGRFIALTGFNAYGDSGTNHTAALALVISEYFGAACKSTLNESTAPKCDTWTTEACEGYAGNELTDEKLIERARKPTDNETALSAFGDKDSSSSKASFNDLWEGDISKFPSESEADFALAGRLLFWTGKDCARTERLMRESDLWRPKWDNDANYLSYTITKANSLQTEYYGSKKKQQPHQAGGDNQESLAEDNSQASLMVIFVANRCELFHDKNKDVYAQNLITKETRRLDGRPFKDWLVANFYESSGKSPREQSVREAISTLSGLARFKGKCNEVHIRVAAHDGEYFLDLGEPTQSRAVRIASGHWEILSDPPVYFLRPETLQPLPEPIGGADLSGLWQLVNIPEDSRLLVIAWLCECLRPDKPFPVLELIGEQGSAKSTTQTLLRRLIDPNACDLRSAPKVIEDIFVSAGVTWLVSYENISHLSAPMQDSLCVLATGGGFAKRKLYTDADESVINVKRPVIINGISVSITAQDLIDRTLSVETPMIMERRETTRLLGIYEAEHGRLLGALLDIIAKAIALLPTIQLPAADRPRLLEFAYLGMAIAEIMGYSGDDFMAQFNTRRQESIARTIEASPVASAMIEWCGKQTTTRELPLKDLYQALLLEHKPHYSDSWPRSPKGLGDALRRVAPALRQMGIQCHALPKKGGLIYWRITPAAT